MHFSSPSGCRLSWWRPWNRGAVGFLYSGYCSVSRFLNMALKVTPKPATGPRNSGIAVLLRLLRLGGAGVGRTGRTGCAHQLAPRPAGPPRHHRRLLSRQGWYGVAAGHRVEPLRWRERAVRRGLAFLLAVPEQVHEQRDEQQREDRAADIEDDPREVVILVAHRPDRGDQHQPHHGDRDEHLPAER